MSLLSVQLVSLLFSTIVHGYIQYVIVTCIQCFCFSCTSIPSNSSCANHEMHFKYAENIDLLQLEFVTMEFIKENVSNQYCRNYLKVAVCVTIYPPCNISNNASVHILCPEECESLLYSSACSSDTTSLTEFVTSLMENLEMNFTINCTNSLSFSNMFLNTTTCYHDDYISILDTAEVPNT